MRKLLLALFCLSISFSLLAQSVTSTGQLNQARTDHQSHVLSDGSVLVFGGNDYWLSNLQKQSSAERYDPATKAWSYTGSMSQERDGFASVLLNDGSVLAIGGVNQAGEALSSSERYTPTTGTWQPAGSMLQPRAYHTAVKLHDGKVLVAGGSVGPAAELYNPHNNTWTSTGSMQLEHGNSMAMLVLNDGKVLATGGQLAPYMAEIYDPITQQWTLLDARTTRSRIGHSMVKLKSGDILIVGSQSFNYSDQQSAEVFSPGSKVFYGVTKPLTGVGGGRSVLLDDGRVLVYSVGDMFTPSNTKCLQFYNPTTRTWTSHNYNFIGANLASVHLLHDSKVLIAGGAWTTGNGASNSSFLVNQDSYSHCFPPRLDLAVNGSNSCNGYTATISMPASEAGINYEAYIGDLLVSESYAGGGPLAITIPEGKLAPGKNQVKVKATRSSCPAYTLMKTALVEVKPSALPKPTITAAGPTAFCPGGSVKLTGPAGMAGYEWNNGATTQQITVTATGFYRLRVKGQDGCFTDYSNVIQVSSPPSAIQAGADETVCVNAASYTLSGFSPAGGVWTGAGVSVAGTFNPAVAGPGKHLLTYSFCGISSSKTVTVTSLPKVNDFSITPGQYELCYNESTYIEIEGAMPGARYEVWNGDRLLETVQAAYNSNYIRTAYHSIRNSPIITVKGIFTNDCGSHTLGKVLELHFRADPRLAVEASTPFLCRQGEAMITVKNTQEDVSYQLMNGNTAVGEPQQGNGQTLSFPTGPLLETSTFTVKGTWNYYCANNMLQTVTIEVAGPLSHFTVSNYNPEVGETIQLLNASQNQGGTYQWRVGSGGSWTTSTAQHPPQLSFAKAGPTTIQLISTGTEGCTNTMLVNLQVIAPVASSDITYAVTSTPDLNIQAQSVTYDAAGNSYLLYKSQDDTYTYSAKGDQLDLVFDDTEQENYGYHQAILKYNPKGTVQWAAYIRHRDNWSHEGDITTDAQGNVYVAYFHQQYLGDARVYSTDGRYTSIKPPYSVHGHYSILVLKFDKHGIFQWHNTFLDQYTINKVALVVDQAQHVYASSDNRLYKFDAAGQYAWHKDKGYADLKLDAAGKLWGVRSDALVVDQYQPNGDLLLSSAAPVKVGEHRLGITPMFLNIDQEGDLYVSGSFYGEFRFGQETISDIYSYGNAHSDLFISKISKSGSQKWLKQVKVDKMIQLKGMDQRHDKIVFLGVALDANLQYNHTPGSGFNDAIRIEQGYFIGTTDTTAAYDMRLVQLTKGATSAYTVPDRLIAFSKTSDRVLFSVPKGVEGVLGHAIATRNIGEFQRDLVTFSTTFQTIFPPVPPTSKFTAGGSRCPGAALAFKDLSGGKPTAWSWKVAGPSPASSTQQHPTFTFSQPGTYTVTLVASNANGTGSTALQEIVIGGYPVVSVSPASVCEGQSITLTASGAERYRWSNGETGASITIPRVTADMTVSVVGISGTGCETTVTHQIKVNPMPQAKILSGIAPLCRNAAAVELPEATPTGGTYSGPGVRNGLFDPALAQPGMNTITYTYTSDQGCTSAATMNVLVQPMPQIAFAKPGRICLGTGIALDGGYPAGGTYSGLGVVNGYFDSAITGAGVFTLTYTYTDQNGCSASATAAIEVQALPQVTFAQPETICISQGPQPLKGAYPEGGVYSGKGVVNGTFVPDSTGVGTFAVTYTYTSNGCSTSVERYIEVTRCTSTPEELEARLLSVYPNPTTGRFTMESELLKTQTLVLTVYSTEGRNVWQRTLHPHASGKQYIDFSGYAKGMYHLQLMTTNNRVLRRNIIIN